MRKKRKEENLRNQVNDNMARDTLAIILIDKFVLVKVNEKLIDIN